MTTNEGEPPMRTKKPKHCPVNHVDPDSLVPIPWPIAFDTAFIKNDELSEREYRDEVKRIVRKHLNTKDRSVLNRRGLFDYYDPMMWKIIKEVMAEN